MSSVTYPFIAEDLGVHFESNLNSNIPAEICRANHLPTFRWENPLTLQIPSHMTVPSQSFLLLLQLAS